MRFTTKRQIVNTFNFNIIKYGYPSRFKMKHYQLCSWLNCYQNDSNYFYKIKGNLYK